MALVASQQANVSATVELLKTKPSIITSKLTTKSDIHNVPRRLGMVIVLGDILRKLHQLILRLC